MCLTKNSDLKNVNVMSEIRTPSVSVSQKHKSWEFQKKIKFQTPIFQTLTVSSKLWLNQTLWSIFTITQVLIFKMRFNKNVVTYINAKKQPYD